MIGILIVAHETLGECLIRCATHVLGGPPPHLMQLGITVQDDPQAIVAEAKQLVESLDLGAGVLVLTDIYGATPCNIACQLLVPGRVEGVAGASLPMLMRALTYRNEPLEALVARAVSGGRDGVTRMPCPDSEKCSIKKPKS
jgi:PTS system ascorbate-specific IIA component